MAKVFEDRALSFTRCLQSLPKKQKNVKKGLISPAQAKIVASIQEMFPQVDIESAVKYLQEKKVPVDVNSLIDAVYQLQEQSYRQGEQLYKQKECLNSEGESCHSDELSAPWTKPEIEEEYSSSESEDDAEDQRKAVINQAKEVLRQKIKSLTVTCKYCNHSRASILLLPCAHVACCESCLMDVRRCPVPKCKKVVRGTKEIFFG